jgi:hypothetical protein
MAQTGGQSTTAWLTLDQALELALTVCLSRTLAERRVLEAFAAAAPDDWSYQHAENFPDQQEKGPSCFWGSQSSTTMNWADNSAFRLKVFGPEIGAVGFDQVILYGITIGRDYLMRFLGLPLTKIEAVVQTRQRPGARKRDAVAAVARILFPPDGMPPEDMSTAIALQTLGNELQRQKIVASLTTQRRAIGRRAD